MRSSLLFLLLLLFIVVVYCSPPQGTSNRLLVVLEKDQYKATHSAFFGQLEDFGYTLHFSSVFDDNALERYGEYEYSGLILFVSSSNEFGTLLDIDAILEFVDASHNVFIATSRSASSSVKELMSEFGVDFSTAQKRTQVVDHLHYDRNLDASSGKNSVIYSSNKSSSLFGEEDEEKILFHGVGHQLAPDSDLVFSILSAHDSAYTYPLKENAPVLAGNTISLVSGFQARNNARVVLAGSIDLFSNKYFAAQVHTGDGHVELSSGNAHFSKQLLAWMLKEKGLLRAINAKHHRVGEEEQPDIYKITESIVFSVDIQEWNGSEWVPYVADDIQLEFRMLDPYIRQNLVLVDPSKGSYALEFRIPDVYGVYTFSIEYTRIGYSNLHLNMVEPIRPFRHDEYERFIPAAYPYYVGAFSMIIGFIIFSFIFFFSLGGPTMTTTQQKKKQ